MKRKYLRKLFYLILIYTINSFSLKAQFTLTIVIKNLESNEGNVLLDFRDGNNLKINEFTKEIINKQCIITITGLTSGNYSFKYFHDANNNKKLDTYWFGAPKEGYGFSNNAKGYFGPPDFEKTLFQLKNNSTLECIPMYIKF